MLMYGQRPEDLERDKLKIELLKVLLDAQAAGAKIGNEATKIVSDIMGKGQNNKEGRDNESV